MTEKESKKYSEKEVVENIKASAFELKAKYLLLMEQIKQLKQIADSVGYEIDFDKAEVKKKTIVKLLK